MAVVLEARKRDTFGKNEARRLRARGLVPAVLYGGREPSVPLEVDPQALLRILHSESGLNTLITLRVDGAEARVLVKQYQLDPVTHRLLHADFYRVTMDRALQVTVPVVLRGEAKGVKQQGGLLDFVHRELVVECLPGDIPDRLEVDVSELAINQGVRVRDLPPSRKWRPVTEPETLIVHVIPPKAEAPPEAEAAAPAAPAEPEVIRKGKAEKAEEEEEA